MTILQIVSQPGWDAGYYTGTVVTGLIVLAFMSLGRK